MNYIFNRLNEFEDPKKAEDKAHYARKSIVELLSSAPVGGKKC